MTFDLADEIEKNDTYGEYDELLTEEEHRLVQQLGSAASKFCTMFKHPFDQEEFVQHIHACQNAVLAQAAARAFPSLYRRLDQAEEERDGSAG